VKCCLHEMHYSFEWRAVCCRTDFQKTVGKILALDYKIPDKLQLSDSVKDLLSKIFVTDPNARISIAGIKAHEWYLHRLPYELCDGYQGLER
jgi:serine/threonine protein kinase